MGCVVLKLLVTYLGILLGANLKEKKVWQPVLNKIAKRLAMWKARLLSRAETLVLIKSVLNNLAMYYLSLFKIPKRLVENIIRMHRQFFWCNDEKGRCIPFVSWDIIQKPKKIGDLGR